MRDRDTEQAGPTPQVFGKEVPINSGCERPTRIETEGC